MASGQLARVQAIEPSILRANEANADAPRGGVKKTAITPRHTFTPWRRA